MIAITELERFKRDEIDIGAFQPTRIVPCGCCRWAVFGRETDNGVLTGNGARRIFGVLTSEIEHVLKLSYVPTHRAIVSHEHAARYRS